MEDEFSILASRWRELQGKRVQKIPQEIVDRDTAIQSLLEDQDAIADGKNGKENLERLTRNIRKLEKINDEAKRALNLQVTEYLPGGTKGKETSAPRDLIPRKRNTKARIRRALNADRS